MGYRSAAMNGQSGDESYWNDADRAFMSRALQLARLSREAGEIPVGAVLTVGGTVIGEGHNRPVGSHDPTSHAETEALRAAAARAGNYRLPGSTLYVTLEPCVMCAGALVIARVSRLVFAVRDVRFGAVRSKFRLADSELLNHRLVVEEGLLGAESAGLLQEFFQDRRNRCGR